MHCAGSTPGSELTGAVYSNLLHDLSLLHFACHAGSNLVALCGA
jgi:hypothetical protein